MSDITDLITPETVRAYVTHLREVDHYLLAHLDEMNRARYQRTLTRLVERANQGNLHAVKELSYHLAEFCALQLTSDPHAPSAVYRHFGSFYTHTGMEFDEASALLKVGLGHHPQDAGLHLDAGKIYMQEAFAALKRKEYDTVLSYVDEAFTALDRASALDPACEGEDVANMMRTLSELARITERRKNEFRTRLNRSVE